MRGLDPRIHLFAKNWARTQSGCREELMDPRVKPGSARG